MHQEASHSIIIIRTSLKSLRDPTATRLKFQTEAQETCCRNGAAEGPPGMWPARPDTGTPAPLAPGELLLPLPCTEGQPPGRCCLPSIGAGGAACSEQEPPRSLIRFLFWFLLRESHCNFLKCHFWHYILDWKCYLNLNAFHMYMDIYYQTFGSFCKLWTSYLYLIALWHCIVWKYYKK